MVIMQLSLVALCQTWPQLSIKFMGFQYSSELISSWLPAFTAYSTMPALGARHNTSLLQCVSLGLSHSFSSPSLVSILLLLFVVVTCLPLAPFGNPSLLISDLAILRCFYIISKLTYVLLLLAFLVTYSKFPCFWLNSGFVRQQIITLHYVNCSC